MPKNVNYGMIVLVAVVAAMISSFVTYRAASKSGMKFAVVDLKRVVVSSKDVAALKNERDSQIQDLKKMADEANVKIKNEKNEAKKKELSEQYLSEINGKKQNYDKVYASALQASDKKLNEIINSVAKKEGLTVVFNKDSIVNGGVDITDSVLEQVR